MSDPFTASPPTEPPPVSGPAPQTPAPPQYPTARVSASATSSQQQGTPPPPPPLSAPPAAPPEPSPQVRRTAAIVVTSLGALLLAAAATVFMVIAWDLLRLPGKVGVVGSASVAFLVAGHQLRHRLSGVAAVLTHLGAVLAPLVAGAGAVALDADRPTVAVAGGVVGLAVLQVFDRMGSPILAAGRALACAGVAVGLGVWLGVSPALLLIVAAAVAGLFRRWDESISTSLLAASTPLVTWGAVFSEPGSLLPWLDELSVMDQWVTALVAMAALIVIAAQAWQLPAPRLFSGRGRWAATVATGIVAINLTAFVDAAVVRPDLLLLLAATSVVVARVIERIWQQSIGLYVDGWAWTVHCLAWAAVLSFDGPLAMQRPELVASCLLLASWLLADLFGPQVDGIGPGPVSRLLHGTGGPMCSIGIATSSAAIAVATGHALGATIGLITLSMLFALSQRAHRAELASATVAAALVAAVGAPVMLPAISVAGIAGATWIIVTDLRRGFAPSELRSVQLTSLAVAGAAVLCNAVVTSPSWWSTGIHLFAFAGSAATLSRRTSVPDFDMPVRLALLGPVVLSLGDLTMAGTFAMVTGATLMVDRLVHHLDISRVLGLGLLTTGSWILAADAGIEASEAYLALPCLILAMIGYDVVRRGGSSWLGLAPAVGCFTLVGVAERLSGGDGWHAVVAGAVAIVAMVVGVDRRWAGPSLVGAAALLAVVGVETAAYVPVVPLWIWLAIGGAFLVGAGIHLERGADEDGTAPLKTAWSTFR